MSPKSDFKISPVKSKEKRIYYGGDLPVEALRFNHIEIEVLRVSYWNLEVWHHRHLGSPYWRFYWNEREGGEILWNEQRIPLLPNAVTIIFPQTFFGTAIAGQTHEESENILIGTPCDEQFHEVGLPHFFAHFLIHEPILRVENGVVQCPLNEDDINALRQLTAALRLGTKVLPSHFSFVLQSLVFKGLAKCPQGTWAEKLAGGRMQKVIDWMENHLHEKIQNADMAHLVAMSPNGFARDFKISVGVSPQEFLLQRRLQRAGILLHHSRDSIETIAERCGFCDRNYFSTHFKKTYGIGPGAYRRSGMK